MTPFQQFGFLFAIAFAVVFAGVVALRRFWRSPLGVDGADGFRKDQKTPVIRLGGLPLYAAFIVGYLFSGESLSLSGSGHLPVEFLLLATAMFLVGLLDDLFGLPAKLKFGAQLTIALIAYLSDMRIDIISNPFGGGALELGGFGILVTVFWFVALPNLINLIDGMDGLAGGVALFLSGTLAAIGIFTGNTALAYISMAMMGGLVAFLFFNLPPARIYMGDGGAYLLGFYIAATSLISSNKGSVIGAILVVVIALGFPILDTALAMVRRSLAGLPVTAPDARHIHHRLQTLGFSKRSILLVLYGVFFSLNLLGIAVFAFEGYALPIAGMIVVVAMLMGLRIIGLPHTPAEAKKVIREVLAARKDIRYAYSLAQVLEHDLDRAPSGEVYWGHLRNALARLGIIPRSEEAQDSEGNGDRSVLVLPVSDELSWHLDCPVPQNRKKQWDRIVRCFQLPLANGMRKWGTPEDMGLRLAVEKSTGTEKAQATRTEHMPAGIASSQEFGHARLMSLSHKRLRIGETKTSVGKFWSARK